MTTLPESRLPAMSAEASSLLATSLGYGLRTPLHSLLGFVELLAISGLDGEQRRMLDDVADGADALYAACDRILCLIRVLSGHTGGQPELIAPAQMLGEVAATSAVEGSVTLRVSNLPAFLEGDGTAVRQIARELVRNAAQHGSRPIAVAAEVVDDGSETANLRLRVTDAGPGLPAAVLRRLQEAPEALPVGTTGVGLYLVRALATALGGGIDIGTPSRGTDILVTVPLRLVDPTQRGNADLIPDSTSPQQALRVLLIEDNPVNRILAERQLARLGHDLDVVTNGIDGVEAALRGGYDIALVDRHLPDIDGVEVTRRIRGGEAASPTGKRIPIVGVSADALPRNREECLDAGMDAFLTKPLDLQRLADTLTEFAPRPQQQLAPVSVPFLDRSALARVRSQLDEDAVHTIVQAFVDDLPARRQELHAAVGKGKARPAAVAAGRLGASSATVGAERLAYLCRSIESAAHADDLDSCHALLAPLAEVTEATMGALLAEFPAVTRQPEAEPSQDSAS